MEKELFFDDKVIRQYVNGELQGQTLIDFEQELKQNNALQTEVDLYAFLIAKNRIERKNHFKTLMSPDTLIEEPIDEAINNNKEVKKTDLKIVNDKKTSLVEEPKKTYKLWPNLMKLAAAALIVTAVGIGWFTFNNQNMGAAQLAENYLEETYVSPVVSRGTDVEKVWGDAVNAYKQSKFDKSAQLIEQIADEGKTNDEQRFYLGLSYLYQNNEQASKAIQQFKQINKGPYLESAKWYQSLAHLKLNNNTEAKKILETLKNSSRKKEVEKLLKSL